MLGLPSAGCSASELPSVSDLRQLRAADPQSGLVRLTQEGRAGVFRWHSGNYARAAAGDPLGGRHITSLSVSPDKGIWIREGTRLSPEMFGATADQSDHTVPLLALFDQLQSGFQVELNEKYILSRGITIERLSNFSIVGGGYIKMRRKTPVDNGYWMIYLAECSNFEINGITLDANRYERCPREVPAHTLSFQSCSQFDCKNVKVVNAVCDGFYLFSSTPEKLDTHCREFRFTNCTASGSFRQGCSVIQGHDGVFRGGAFLNTKGTAPEAGIDLESDQSDPIGAISRISIEGVRFAGNSGFGLLVATVSRPSDIEAIDCVFDHNAGGAISWGATGGRIVRPQINGFRDTAIRGAIDVPAGDGWREGPGTVIEQPRFTAVTTTRPENALVYTHSEAYGPVAIDGMSTDACGAIAGLNRDRSSLRHSTITASLGRVDGAISISGRGCEVVDNHITQFYGSAIICTGDNVVVRDNRLDMPRYNDDNGAIRILGKDASVGANVISGKAARTAIRLDGRNAILGANRISGFLRPVHDGKNNE